MSELAARRPVFHSERDFQQALAWQIQLNYPQASRRFHATGIVTDLHEGPPPGENDIIAIMRAEALAPASGHRRRRRGRCIEPAAKLDAGWVKHVSGS